MKQFKLHDHHFTDTATPGVRLRLYATFFFNVELPEKVAYEITAKMCDDLAAAFRERANNPLPEPSSSQTT